MPTQTLYPGLNAAGTSITVYAEDGVTLITAAGAVVSLVQESASGAFVLPEYYRIKCAQGQLLTADPLGQSGDPIDVPPITRASGSLIGLQVTELHLIPITGEGEVRYCNGYAANGDGGGGAFAGTLGTPAVAEDGFIRIDAPGGQWQRIEVTSVIPQMFGAVADGISDCTAALKAWATFIQVNGGGQARIPPGTYRVLRGTEWVNGSTLCAFSGLPGLSIDVRGTIVDETVYSGSQSSRLFAFTACSNVVVSGLKVESQSLFSASFAPNWGLDAITLLQGCANITVDFEMVGGRDGVIAYRLAADPLSYRSSGITVRGKCYEVHYPYVGQFSGDLATVELDCTRCGRDFYLYGVKDVTVRVKTRDQQVTSQIAAYSGLGCESVSVSLVDTESVLRVSAAPQLEITYGDSTPATIRDVHVHLNLKNPSAAPRSHALGFNKFSDGGGTPDGVGRGHVLEGFRLTGRSDNTGVAVSHMNMNAGAFATPDVIRKFVIEDFVGLGAASPITAPLGVLEGTSAWSRVKCEHNIYAQNYGVGRVAFDSCEAANFSVSTSTTEVHDYYSCRATDGTAQGRESTGKRFYGGFRLGSTRPIPDSIGDAPYVVRASSCRAVGSIAGPHNIFRVRALTAVAVFRVKYFLTADQADWNSATRDETFGIKTFTASINGLGAWTLQSAIADEVTERTLGTASVLTLTLVDGDADGAFIAAACTNYTGAGARAVFALEMTVARGDAWAEAGS
jgi:hypothetical protein